MQPDLQRPTDRAVRLRIVEDAAQRREFRVAIDEHAPATARAVLAACLGDGVSASAAGDAVLLVSELVSNSVMHSGARADEQLVLRIEVQRSAVRIEVEDPGHWDGVALRTPDDHGGFGMSIVRAISERWGIEPVAAGGTRVWAQIAMG